MDVVTIDLARAWVQDTLLLSDHAMENIGDGSNMIRYTRKGEKRGSARRRK